MFPTARGGPDDRKNARNRAFARSVDRANKRLADAGRTPLPERLTSHSLRRTYASLLVASGEDPTYVMDQLGHSDPKLTLRIYSHTMRRRDGERERLHALVTGQPASRLGTSAQSTPTQARPRRRPDEAKTTPFRDERHGPTLERSRSRRKRAASASSGRRHPPARARTHLAPRPPLRSPVAQADESPRSARKASTALSSTSERRRLVRPIGRQRPRAITRNGTPGDPNRSPAHSTITPGDCAAAPRQVIAEGSQTDWRPAA